MGRMAMRGDRLRARGVLAVMGAVIIGAGVAGCATIPQPLVLDGEPYAVPETLLAKESFVPDTVVLLAEIDGVQWIAGEAAEDGADVCLGVLYADAPEEASIGCGRGTTVTMGGRVVGTATLYADGTAQEHADDGRVVSRSLVIHN